MALSSSARRWIALIAVALGVALIVVDTTIVNVITPSVIDDLGIDSSQAQWIQEGYTIVFAALLLVAGRLSDLWGAKKLFLAGSVFFGLTSVLAGLAWSGEVLIAARFLQGVGAAAILPTSLALLNHMFTGKARGMAFAVWGTTIGAATAVGPVIGGWLSEYSTWRWAFGLNVPLVIVILIVQRSGDAECRRDDRAAIAEPGHRRHRRHGTRGDVAGPGVRLVPRCWVPGARPGRDALHSEHQDARRR